MSGLRKRTCLILAVLFVNKLEASCGSAMLPSGATFKDSRVYWNVPTFMCHKYGMRFEEVSRDFRIIQNADDQFRGDEITMLYDPGMFPALLKSSNGQVKLEYRKQPDTAESAESFGIKILFPTIAGSTIRRNGGVPQAGNLKNHLKLFKEQVIQHIPDSSYRGLAIIDFESWRPIFRQNWASLDPYRVLSEKIVRDKHPSWDAKSQKREAVRQFEKWGRIFMEETLKAATATRPEATWGYYAYPYCFNYTPHQNSWQCDSQVLKENNNMSWLFAAENVVLPSVYLRSTLTGKQKMGLVRGRVAEAIRMARKSNPRRKVLVYTWYKYQDQNDVFLSQEDAVNGFREINDSGADGYVIWGSSFDLNSRKKCENFRNYLNDVLGPAVVGAEELASQQEINYT